MYFILSMRKKLYLYFNKIVVMGFLRTYNYCQYIAHIIIVKATYIEFKFGYGSDDV